MSTNTGTAVPPVRSNSSKEIAVHFKSVESVGPMDVRRFNTLRSVDSVTLQPSGTSRDESMSGLPASWQQKRVLSTGRRGYAGQHTAGGTIDTAIVMSGFGKKGPGGFMGSKVPDSRTPSKGSASPGPSEYTVRPQ